MAEPYDTINQYILDDTKRPDMQDEIDRRIIRALTYYHRKDNWKRDLQEVSIEIPAQAAADEAANIIRLDLTDILLFPRPVRQFLYIRRTQWPITGNDGTYDDSGDFTERSPDRMFDGFGGDLQDVFYRSGNDLILKPSESIDTIYIGYYADPNLPADGDTLVAGDSWIADNYQSLIAARVKKQIFRIIGKEQEQKEADKEEQEEFLVLAGNNIRTGVA